MGSNGNEESGLRKPWEAMMKNWFFGRRIQIVIPAFFLVPVLLMLWSRAAVGAVDSGWQAAWNKTLSAANTEGKVVVYGSTDFDRVFAEFQKKYPRIEVVSVIGRGAETAQRIMTERRGRKYIADVYIGGASTGYNVLYKGGVFDPIKPALILPEVLDESNWFKGHLYLDDAGENLFGFGAIALPFVGYNTRLVNPKDFKSYWDLLDPKWKGKMIGLDPTLGSAVNTYLTFIYYNPALGPKFLRRLLEEMDLNVSRDTVQIVNQLAAGKYPISIFTTPSRAGLDDAKAQGLPVDWFGPAHFKEGMGLGTSNGNLGLVNRAPHPNAARVAINWLLSRDGQMAYQQIIRTDSRRIDIPKDSVRPSTRRIDGARYLEVDSPAMVDMKPVMEVVKEAWKR